MADSLQLITRLIDAGASYLHASLGNALDQKPAKSGADATIVSILCDHIGGRVSLVAAGGIRIPAQAEDALNMGLSLVAVGQGLVMNPDWIAHARAGRDRDIRLSISATDVVPASIPRKLWEVIDATPGWFNVVEFMPDDAGQRTSEMES